MFAQSCFSATRATHLPLRPQILSQAARMLTRDSGSSLEPGKLTPIRYLSQWNEYEPEHREIIKYEKDTRNVFALTEDLVQKMEVFHTEIAKIQTSDPDLYKSLNQIHHLRLQPILELRDTARNILVTQENEIRFERWKDKFTWGMFLIMSGMVYSPMIIMFYGEKENQSLEKEG